MVKMHLFTSKHCTRSQKAYSISGQAIMGQKPFLNRNVISVILRLYLMIFSWQVNEALKFSKKSLVIAILQRVWSRCAWFERLELEFNPSIHTAWGFLVLPFLYKAKIKREGWFYRIFHFHFICTFTLFT